MVMMKKYKWILSSVVALTGMVWVAIDRAQDQEEESLPAGHSAVKTNETVGDSFIPAGDGSSVESAGNNEATIVPTDGRIPLPSPYVLAASPGSVPEHLHFLFGWGDAGVYQARNRKINLLARDLSPAEIEAMLAFLHMQPHEVGLSADDFHATGDTLMEKLEAQYELHPDYTDHLAVIFYDKSYTEVWRDYCLQHMGSTYKRMAPEKLPILEQLYEDALIPGSGMEGVGVLAMKNSIGGKGITKKLVSENAYGVATNAVIPDSSRLSALLVSAELNHPETLEYARLAVNDRNNTAHFRVACIAAMGLRGNATDLPRLEKYTKSSDIRLRESSRAAVRKINARLVASE